MERKSEVVAVAAILLAVGTVASGAPDPRLAGLTEVRLEFRGLLDHPSQSETDVRESTGLSPADWGSLRQELQTKVKEQLTVHSVRVSTSAAGCCAVPESEIVPTLTFSVSTTRAPVEDAGTYYEVKVELMEPARLLRRPTECGTVATWSNSWIGFSEPTLLPFHITHAATFWAKAFGEAWTRSTSAEPNR